MLGAALFLSECDYLICDNKIYACLEKKAYRHSTKNTKAIHILKNKKRQIKLISELSCGIVVSIV